MIELMVTVAVAGILLAIAAPAMKTVITGRAVASQASELVAAMHFARAEAMKRSAPVTICKVTVATPTVCSNSGSTTWQNWMIFSENSGTGTGNTIGVHDGSEPILRQQYQTPTTLVSWQAASPALLNYVAFQATGIAVPNVSNAGAATSVRFLINPVMSGAGTTTFKRYARQVCLNAQGRADVIDGNATCP